MPHAQKYVDVHFIGMSVDVKVQLEMFGVVGEIFEFASAVIHSLVEAL